MVAFSRLNRTAHFEFGIFNKPLFVYFVNSCCCKCVYRKSAVINFYEQEVNFPHNENLKTVFSRNTYILTNDLTIILTTMVRTSLSLHKCNVAFCN